MKSHTNLYEATRKKIYGLIIPVIPKQQFIEYKTKVGPRKIDEVALREIAKKKI